MSHAPVVAVREPKPVLTFQGSAPVRGIDWGKWSDVEAFLSLLDGGGAVCNLSMLLAPIGAGGRYKGMEVTARVTQRSREGVDQVFVNAGSDPCYDAVSTIDELESGEFDRGELVLCVLSTLNFRSLVPCDLHIDIISPVPPGASLGTSASLEVALLRALLGEEEDPCELAMRALHCEKVIAGRNTGNQDQLAAGYGSVVRVGSPAQMITVRGLFDASVTVLPVKQNIAHLLGNTLVAVIGQHDSSDTHRELMERLAGDEAEATVRLTIIKETAEEARRAFLEDRPGDLLDAIDGLLGAQKGLSPALVGEIHSDLILHAKEHLGHSAVPGAGGEGGSVISVFPDEEKLDAHAEWIVTNHPSVRLFRASYPGLS